MIKSKRITDPTEDTSNETGDTHGFTGMTTNSKKDTEGDADTKHPHLKPSQRTGRGGQNGGSGKRT